MATKRKLINASNFLDFDWNKAKLFYHIAQCGSFVKTAQLIGTDQPSLTRQIQTLEKQVGCPLLIRRAGAKGGVSLTRKGEELLEKVTPFFLEMKGFCGNYYAEIGKEKKRKIRIAASHAVASYVISELILEYAQKNPDIVFELIGDDRRTDIILSDVDIAIQPFDQKLGKKIDGVHYEYLFSMEKKLYASDAYISTYGEPQTSEDLANHHIVAFPQPYAYSYYQDISWILSLGMPEGKYHTPAYVSNSIDSLVDAAKRGVGIIGIYEQFKVVKNSGLKNILPKFKDTPLKEYFIYPDYLKDDETILDIKKYLMKKLNSTSASS